MTIRLYLGASSLMGIEELLPKFYSNNRSYLNACLPGERDIRDYLLPSLKMMNSNKALIPPRLEERVAANVEQLAKDGGDLTICRPKLLCSLQSAVKDGQFYKADAGSLNAVEKTFRGHHVEAHFTVLPIYDYLSCVARKQPLLRTEFRALEEKTVAWYPAVREVSKCLPDCRVYVWDMERGQEALEAFLLSLFTASDKADVVKFPATTHSQKPLNVALMPDEWQEYHDTTYEDDLSNMASLQNVTVITSRQ